MKGLRERDDAAFAEVRPKAGVRLGDLVRDMRGTATLHGDGDVRVSGVHHDSRRVEPGDLFVARRGRTSNGLDHVPSAVGRGAAALLLHEDDARTLEASSSLGVPVLATPTVPKAMAYAASAVYGHPSFALAVVGVTGTNGKTTTAHLVRRAIDAAEDGPTTGILGTVGHVYRDFAIAASHTTPESDEVARVMAVMAKRGAKNVVMEVSSIAVSEGRVDGVHFRVAAFTNFTQDHLDYHGTMEAYGAAKARLFHELAPGTAVVCVDSPFGATLADDVETRHVHGVVRVSTSSVPSSAGTSGRHVDFAPIDVTFGPNGIEGRVHTPRGIVPLRSPLVGRHNLENLLVTLGVVHALDLDVAKAARALADEIGAPGRLERVSAATDDVTVLVDYAHTPDALERVLDAVRGVSSGALLCVFGCGGDRDAKKRAPMGEAAGNRADRIVLTNDNPRTESPEAIAAAVERGLVASGCSAVSPETLRDSRRAYAVILDRARAIDVAIQVAQPGDVVVIAGKGHEDYQIVGREVRPFDDAEHARRALAVRRGAPGRG